MDLEKLCNTYADLIQHMQNDGYSDDYVRRLKTEINWLMESLSGLTLTMNIRTEGRKSH